ncbi:MAG: cytochrome c3 family protein [Deltaproteobacteria bacterium]|nr:cytochrome c3 family protein [Deltaproteobacteria bacterium]
MNRRSGSGRKKCLGAVVFFVAVLSLVCGSIAAAPDASQSLDVPNIKAGLWKEGKAVFSDVPIFDVFLQYARGYRPQQPVKFSHKTHVEVNKMECQYCHSGVHKSSFATVPSLELCMGCHNTVRPELPDIQALKKSYEVKEPISWEPVNHLPEHVVFNHERHVKGGVGCQNCHGQVQLMDQVEMVSSLKMGFCVSCHREYGASLDCAVCHY